MRTFFLLMIGFSNYHGNGDLWIVRLGEMSSAIEAPQSSVHPLKIYPNLGVQTNTIYVEHDLPKAERLVVRDISGQTIFEKGLDGNGQNISISISNYSPGTYILTLYSPIGIQMGKLIISD